MTYKKFKSIGTWLITAGILFPFYAIAKVAFAMLPKPYEYIFWTIIAAGALHGVISMIWKDVRKRAKKRTQVSVVV